MDLQQELGSEQFGHHIVQVQPWRQQLLWIPSTASHSPLGTVAESVSVPSSATGSLQMPSAHLA